MKYKNRRVNKRKTTGEVQTNQTTANRIKQNGDANKSIKRKESNLNTVVSGKRVKQE